MSRIARGGAIDASTPAARHDIAIVGGGTAGAAVAASPPRPRPDLDVAAIDLEPEVMA